jgi:hypothetical protein
VSAGCHNSDKPAKFLQKNFLNYIEASVTQGERTKKIIGFEI